MDQAQLNQNLTEWLQSGAHLNSPSAIAGLAALLTYFVLPIVFGICKRFGTEFNASYKLQIVAISGVGLTLAVGYFTGSTTPVMEQITTGWLAAQTAVGFHQLTSKAKAASERRSIVATLGTAVAPLRPINVASNDSIDKP